MLQVRASDAPDGVLAVDAESAYELRAALGKLAKVVTVTITGPATLRLAAGANDVTLTTVDARDVPQLPSIGGATWAPIPAADWKGVGRVAKCAAGSKEDRPGLAYVRLGPQFADATDEILVTRSVTGLPWGVRVLADLVPFVGPESPSGTVSVGDLGGGAVALASSAEPDMADVVLVFDGRPTAATWTPELGGVWGAWDAAGAPPVLVTVDRSEATAAARAAAAGCDTSAVEIVISSAGVAFGGGTAVVHVSIVPGSEPPDAQTEAGGVVCRTPPPGARAVVLVDVGAFVAATAGLSKLCTLTWRAHDRPIEVSDVNHRTLIFPVVRTT